jgi:ankyrin repeat protein
MARLLILHKADAEHINDDGVPPPFHLFQPGVRQYSSATRELLDIALPYSIANLNFQSCEGWTPLHRAAAYGTGDDIDDMVKRGADVTLRTAGFGWTPAFVAVHFDNTVTCERLLHYSEAGAIRQTDARGWTMLHVAAQLVNPTLITLLISHGADVHATSAPSSTPMPDCTQSYGLTPLEEARASGPDQLHGYILGLQKANVDVHVDLDGVFWPVEG